MKAPCKDCEKRYYACHDTCAEYQTFRKWKDDDNAKRRLSWQEERVDYSQTRKRRLRG